MRKKKKIKKKKILFNMARCKKCGDVVRSYHTHDLHTCRCGTIFVDGGEDYLRRGGDMKYFEDLSEVEK